MMMYIIKSKLTFGYARGSLNSSIFFPNIPSVEWLIILICNFHAIETWLPTFLKTNYTSTELKKCSKTIQSVDDHKIHTKKIDTRLDKLADYGISP